MADVKHVLGLHFVILLVLQLSWQFPHGTGKIVGGSAINITDAPYVASIEFMGRFSCPAVIISPRWLASSAVCMDLLTPDDILVRTGATEYETGGQLWQVQQIVMQPNLSYSDQYAADLSLIQTTVDIVQDDYTKVISIADSAPSAGTLARVSGWGSIAEGSIMHRALLSVELPIYDQNKCDEYFNTELRLCTLKEGAGPCDEDDGDPLVANNQLVGIKSWILAEQCGRADRPSPYVNLAHPVIRDFVRTTAAV